MGSRCAAVTAEPGPTTGPEGNRTVRYEWLVGRRYTRPKRSSQFVAFLSVISMAGVALGVAALIVVLSVVNGFEHEFRKGVLTVTMPKTPEAAARTKRIAVKGA